jgi:[pyruvate, water dikinase]-phosphate phosphotransferase / [pyruvate, water dikinase] kinase
MTQATDSPRIYIISGGVGASAEQLVHTVLAQFPQDTVKITTLGNVRYPEQIESVLRQALCDGCLVVHTLIEPKLREYLIETANQLQVEAIDLMGPLAGWVTRKLGTPPLGQPGLYRQLHREYFDRVMAIDYAIAHDDGKNPQDWPQAEALLVGVSRVGKTPLSLYLAVLGLKVANYPYTPPIPFPPALFELDSRRVIGLTIEPGQLLQFRQRRQAQLGAPGESDYVNPQSVFEEIEEAEKVFRRNRFTVIDMTDKTIELGADEIIRKISQL